MHQYRTTLNTQRDERNEYRIMYKETSCQIRMNMHLTYETGISFVLYNASRVSNKKVKSGASKDLFMLYAGGYVIVIVVEFVLKF